MLILPHLRGLPAGNAGSNTFKSAALDLNFSTTKSLVDSVSGNNLISFTRAGSAANAATYVDSSGVLRSAVTNLNTNSEAFDTYGTSAGSVSANAGTAPNGTLTADEITSTGGGVFKSISGTTASTSLTISVYAKYVSGGGLFTFGFDANPSAGRADFNLQTGALAGNVGANVVSYSIAPIGNGWYRCSVTAVATTTSAVVVFYSSTSGAKWLCWGAQLEQSSTVGDYVPTGATINSAPRFTHDPTTGESLGLLVEEQRSNLLLRSEEFDDAGWTKTNTTVTANAIASPTGNVDADLIIDTSASAEHYFSQPCSTTTNQTYTQSIFAKAGTAPNFRIMVIAIGSSSATSPVTFTQTAGVFVAGSVGGLVTSATAVAVGNGWYRCSVTYTLNGTVTAHQMRIYPYLTGVYIGTGLGTYFWGAQLEAGAFATSYIPTTSATVTRAADVASITGANFSSFYNQSEGTVFVDVNSAPVATVIQTAYDINDGTTSERIFTRRLANGTIGTAITDNSVLQATIGGFAIAASARYRSSLAYKLNDFSGSVNSATNDTASSGTLPTVTAMNIGATQAGANPTNGTIRRLTYWPVRLENTVLQQITQ